MEEIELNFCEGRKWGLWGLREADNFEWLIKDGEKEKKRKENLMERENEN